MSRFTSTVRGPGPPGANSLSWTCKVSAIRRICGARRKCCAHDAVLRAPDSTIAGRALLAKIADDRLFALYLCAIVLGMRRGELPGLTWHAVELDDARLAAASR